MVLGGFRLFHVLVLMCSTDILLVQFSMSRLCRINYL